MILGISYLDSALEWRPGSFGLPVQARKHALLLADKAGEGAEYFRNRAQDGTEYVRQRTDEVRRSAAELYEKGRHPGCAAS